MGNTYDTGGFDTLGINIDGLSRGLEQTRITIERAGAEISGATQTLNKQFVETTISIGSSAAVIKSSVENSSTWLINALKVSNEAATKNAQEIRDQIAELSLNLAHASSDLQAASTQSSRLGRRLNWLTGALVFAGVITATATAFQAYGDIRQANLMEEQLHLQRQTPPAPVSKARPEPNSSVTPPKK